MRDIGDDTAIKREANMLSALFGGPVYLVGSALDENNADPRDWDLRLCLPDEWFALRYAPMEAVDTARAAKVVADWCSQHSTGKFTAMYWRWANEMVRYSNIARRQCGVNIDFQVFPESFFALFRGNPSLRLDTRSELE